MFFHSIEKYWQRDATRCKKWETDGCRWKHVDFQRFLCVFFLPGYKIEDVDPINLEPQELYKFRTHKVT